MDTTTHTGFDSALCAMRVYRPMARVKLVFDNAIRKCESLAGGLRSHFGLQLVGYQCGTHPGYGTVRGRANRPLAPMPNLPRMPWLWLICVCLAAIAADWSNQTPHGQISSIIALIVATLGGYYYGGVCLGKLPLWGLPVALVGGLLAIPFMLIVSYYGMRKEITRSQWVSLAIMLSCITAIAGWAQYHLYSILIATR